MRTPLRPFEARATASGTDAFRSARRRLTAIYCGILAAIIAVLSLTLYGVHSTDVERLEREGRRERQGRSLPEGLRTVVPPEGAILPGDDGEQEGRLFDRSSDLAIYLRRLGLTILFADLVTLVVGGAASALLAGRTLRPIRAAMEAEKQFFLNAAHDLRTPLAVMKSEAEVALRAGSVSAEEARRLVASSLEEIDRMAVMVEQVLDLARGEQAQTTSSRELMDMAACVRAMVDKAQARAGERGVRLCASASEPAQVRADPVAVQRAVGNLVDNSLAYTPPGGSIEVSVRRAHGHVLVLVEDTGIGIPEEDLPHITEPFFRGDRARGAHTGGAGLGLTIVKSIMDAHGGTLKAARRPTAGTVMTLRFPAA